MTSSPSIILTWSRSVETSVYCVVNPVEFPSVVVPYQECKWREVGLSLGFDWEESDQYAMEA